MTRMTLELEPIDYWKTVARLKDDQVRRLQEDRERLEGEISALRREHASEIRRLRKEAPKRPEFTFARPGFLRSSPLFESLEEFVDRSTDEAMKRSAEISRRRMRPLYSNPYEGGVPFGGGGVNSSGGGFPSRGSWFSGIREAPLGGNESLKEGAVAPKKGRKRK